MADQPYSYGGGYPVNYGDTPMLYAHRYEDPDWALPSSSSMIRGFGLLLLVVFTCWGSYLEDTGTGFASIMANASQILVLLLGVMLLCSLGFTGSSFVFTSEFVLLLLFFVWCLIGVPFAASIELSRIATVSLFKLLAMAFIVLNVVNGRQAYVWLLVGLMLTMLLATSGAITGLARGGELVDGRVRYAGTFGNANEAGRLACVGAWAAFSVLLVARGRFSRILLVSILVWSVVIIAWTASKGALLGLAAGGAAAYWFVLRKSSQGVGSKAGWLLVMVICFGSVGAYYAGTYVGERFADFVSTMRTGVGVRSDLARQALLMRSFEIFIQNPVLGVGYGCAGLFMRATDYMSPHNTLIAVAANTGVPGWLLFFGSWWVIVNRLRRIGKLPVPLADYRIALTGWMFLAMWSVWTLNSELPKDKLFWICFAGLVAYLAWIERTYRTSFPGEQP